MVLSTGTDLPPPNKRVQNTNKGNGKSGSQANGKLRERHSTPQEHLISLISKERALDLESGHLRLLALSLTGCVILDNLVIFLSLSLLSVK